MGSTFDAVFGRVYVNGAKQDLLGGFNFDSGLTVVVEEANDGPRFKITVAAPPSESSGVPALYTQALTAGTPSNIALAGVSGDFFQVVGTIDVTSDETPGTLDVFVNRLSGAVSPGVTIDLSLDSATAWFAAMFDSTGVTPEIGFQKTGGGVISVRYSFSVVNLGAPA